jgi:hypothetical protein
LPDLKLVIQTAWAKAGLFPYNPSVVLTEMAEFNPPEQLPRPITPENAMEFSFIDCGTGESLKKTRTFYDQYIA